MNKTLKKIFNIAIDVLIVLVVLISALVVIMSVSSSASGVPNIFGITMYSVQSGSMESTFYEGDLIFGQLADENTEYEVGDIITFIDSQENDMIKTHRIVRIESREGYSEQIIITQGDNPETNSVEDDGFRLKHTILSKYSGTKWSGFGKVMDILRSQTGFFFAIVLPMIAFFLYQAYRVVKNLIEYNKEKALLGVGEELSDEQKKAIAEEYLKQQELSEVQGNSPPEELKEELSEEVAEGENMEEAEKDI